MTPDEIVELEGRWYAYLKTARPELPEEALRETALANAAAELQPPQQVSGLDDKWAAHIRAQHPELSEEAVHRIAKASANSLVDPPTPPVPTPQPLDWTLPFWARAALAMGGKNMLAKMVGNKVTTTIGAFIGLGTTLCLSGVLPPNWCPYVAAATGIATSLGFIAAKDGSTGSPPGATS